MRFYAILCFSTLQRISDVNCGVQVCYYWTIELTRIAYLSRICYAETKIQS